MCQEDQQLLDNNKDKKCYNDDDLVKKSRNGSDRSISSPPSNSHVLGIAFYSFLGFTVVQLGFAVKANSSAMMADSEAMFVDAGTYLLNWLAESVKNNGSKDSEQRKMQRLYLELIPPLLSVCTLLVVTFVAMKQSFAVLMIDRQGDNTDDAPVDLNIMLFFSGLNLLLDVVNVLYFAKANQAILSLDFETTSDENNDEEEARPESTYNSITSDTRESTHIEADTISLTSSETMENGLNLNMCSAWTHVFADTLRSIAVLIAAGFAHLFPQTMTPAESDAYAAVVVSFIILLSCLPLLRGLYHTAREIARNLWGAQQRAKTERLPVLEEIVIAV